jgi:hypothetical protein
VYYDTEATRHDLTAAALPGKTGKLTALTQK